MWLPGSIWGVVALERPWGVEGMLPPWLWCLLAGVLIDTSWKPDPELLLERDRTLFRAGVVSWSKIESPLDCGLPK